MAWNEIASELEWDGALRDIYIVDVTLDDWQKILEQLREAGLFACAFYVDSQELSSAPDAKVIFERRQKTATLLQVTSGKVHLNCHFFSEEEVEFDLDPRDLKCEEDLPAVVAFMSFLAKATAKPAILTHENSQDSVILTVLPGL